ncbi:MAG TPA: RDD family protein [Vicinamibacterales bacterium]|nr:RDD family protein [Vicinamibacterales bacterium]
MKCPKCEYLGFETGDRCKNCGYDFSLLAPAPPAVPDFDVDIKAASEDARPQMTPWIDELDRMFGAPAPVHDEPPAAAPPPAARLEPLPASAPNEAPPVPAFALDETPMVPPPAFRGEPSLPLFTPASAEDDEPLVKLPAAPRPPLAVRRTPDRPRLRAVSRPLPDPEPELEFAEAPASEPTPAAPPRLRAMPVLDGPISSPGRRVAALAIDHAILFGIDFIVLYFTLRLASLTLADWRMLPAVPFVAFLVMLKVAYFAAFTAVGGQTIGKMAAGIRVVTDARGLVEPSQAVQRTLAGALSVVTLGLAFVPALFGADKRALHDRLAHTRVVHS